MATRHRGLALADGISLLRIPLAAAFLVIDNLAVRFGLLALAAASDLGDGWVARRWGGSRAGTLIDPVTDKLFMLAAFLVVWQQAMLSPLQMGAVLLRDLIASIAFFLTLLTGRRTAVAARAGGKLVTALQGLTLIACLLAAPIRHALVWATAAAALYALQDYALPFFRKLRAR